MSPAAPPRVPLAPRAKPWAPLRPFLAASKRRSTRASKSAGGVAASASAAVAAALAVAVREAETAPVTPLAAPPPLPALLADALAGGLACAAQDVMFFADTLKVRRQSGVPLLQGGAKALFAGAGPSMAFRFAHGALYLPIYVSIKHALRDAAQLPTAAAVVAAAAAATCCTALVELPVEALLLRVKSGSGSFGCAARAALARPGGVAALWAGAGPYVMRHVLYEAAEFVVYEQLRERELRRRAAGVATASSSADAHAAGLDARTAAVLAAAAGAAATVASHPLDVLRVAVSLSGAAGKPVSVAAALGTILRARGPAGLAAGLLPRLAATVPGAVIFFTTFEAARAKLGPPEEVALHHATPAVVPMLAPLPLPLPIPAGLAVPA